MNEKNEECAQYAGWFRFLHFLSSQNWTLYKFQKDTTRENSGGFSNISVHGLRDWCVYEASWATASSSLVATERCAKNWSRPNGLARNDMQASVPLPNHMKFVTCIADRQSRMIVFIPTSLQVEFSDDVVVELVALAFSSLSPRRWHSFAPSWRHALAPGTAHAKKEPTWFRWRVERKASFHNHLR